MEGGIVKHLAMKNIPRAEICPQDLGSIERQLRNGDLMMTYYLMLAGFVLSAVIFCTELSFRFINEHSNHTIAKNKAVSMQNAKDNNTSFTPSPPPPYQSVYQWQEFNKNKPKPWSLTRYFKQNELQYPVNKKFGFLAKSLNQPERFSSKPRFINGREYYVSVANDGTRQLIPVRVPSATLFQYNYV